MDAFEALIAELLRCEGYWTIQGFKVNLTKEEKRAIGRHSSPRWELDVLAYKGATNELLVVECKSYLDSPGVLFADGVFGRINGAAKKDRYKLFNDTSLREVVFHRLVLDLTKEGYCPEHVKPALCLAAGKLTKSTNPDEVESHLMALHPAGRLLGPDWIDNSLREASKGSYENDVAHVVAKLIHRRT